MSDEKKTVTEEFKVSGASLVDEIKKLVHEGNVTHIVIRDESGRQLMEIPLVFGIVGIAILPVIAAVGTIAVLAARYTISVTRTEP